MRLLFLLLALLIPSFRIQAQSQLQITNQFTTKDGLCHNYIFCMEEDSRGFLWIGTYEGLNRYDGFRFETYFTERNNFNSLSHNSVYDILEYIPGKMLIATASGLSVLNTFTGQFENEKINFPPLRATSGTKVCSLYKDPEGNIWVNHSGELDVFDANLNYLYRFTDLGWAKSLKGVSIYLEEWYTDKKGQMWLATDTSGIQIINFKSKKVINQKNNPDHLDYMKYDFIRSIMVDEENNYLWVCPWGDGIIKYNLATGQKLGSLPEKRSIEEANSVNFLFKSQNGSILFILRNRFYEMNPHTMQYYSIGSSSPYLTLDNEFIYGTNFLYETRRHDFLIGSFGCLYYLKIQNSISFLNVLPENLNNSCIDLLLTDSSKIYLAFENSNQLVVMDEKREICLPISVPLLAGSVLTEVCEDHQGRIWIGTNNGILLFDIKENKFANTSFLHPELKHAGINLLFCDQEGNIWIGTRWPFDLYCYHPKTGKTDKTDNHILKSFKDLGVNARISDITQESNGRIWMSSQLGGGLLSYIPDTDEWALYPVKSHNYKLVGEKGIVTLYPDNKGNLWIANWTGDGLMHYNYMSDSITQYTREDGLLSGYIHSIVSDQDNELWLITNNGVTLFDPIKKSVISHSLFDLQIALSSKTKVVFDPIMNTLIMPCDRKMLQFSTENKDQNHQALTPVLDRVYVNNVPQYTDPEQPILKLNHHQKNITFDFTAVYFSTFGNLEFAYQLSGADTTWKYTKLSRTAQYSFLDPGKYTFKLKVADEAGVWSQSHDMLSFVILPPFWQTRWFIFSSLCLLSITGYGVVQKRIKSFQYDASLKQKIAETEMMALRAQMNPHFIFNCINSIDALIQSNSKYQATIYLNKFAKLIRNVLDSSKVNNMTLAKDLETLKLYIELEQFRNENKFTADIHADPSLLQGDYKVPPLIIQPYVENAIIHGLRNRSDNEGKLSISVTKKDSYIHYIVEDNGVGRKNTFKDPSNEKKSYGMEMSSERIKLFNQEEHASVTITDLEADSIPSGTRVEVLLKMV